MYDSLAVVRRTFSLLSHRGSDHQGDMVTTNPLFKFGVDIEAVDADGKTALHRAAMFSDQDKVLISPGLMT